MVRVLSVLVGLWLVSLAQQASAQNPPTTLVVRFSGAFVGDTSCMGLAGGGVGFTCTQRAKEGSRFVWEGRGPGLATGPLSSQTAAWITIYAEAAPVRNNVNAIVDGVRWAVAIMSVRGTVVTQGSADIVGTSFTDASGAMKKNKDSDCSFKESNGAFWTVSQF